MRNYIADKYYDLRDSIEGLWEGLTTRPEGYIGAKQMRRLEELVEKARNRAIIESTLRTINEK